MVFGEGACHGKAKNSNNNNRMKGMCLFALTVVVVVVVVDVCMILLERSPWQSQSINVFFSLLHLEKEWQRFTLRERRNTITMLSSKQ